MAQIVEVEVVDVQSRWRSGNDTGRRPYRLHPPTGIVLGAPALRSEKRAPQTGAAIQGNNRSGGEGRPSPPAQRSPTDRSLAELPRSAYAVNDIVRGEVVNIRDYGVFVQLEPGIDAIVKERAHAFASRSIPPRSLGRWRSGAGRFGPY
jgi:hypothetical protein